jgi:hypothetical protein
MRASSNGRSMTNPEDKSSAQTRTASKETRQDRLKLALRENLKRRKLQERGRSDAASSEPSDGPKDDAGGKPGR